MGYATLRSPYGSMTLMRGLKYDSYQNKEVEMANYLIDTCSKCGTKQVLVIFEVKETDLAEMHLDDSELKSVFEWRCQKCKNINKLYTGILHGPGTEY